MFFLLPIGTKTSVSILKRFNIDNITCILTNKDSLANIPLNIPGAGAKLLGGSKLIKGKQKPDWLDEQ